jgi:hypothetical protein
MFHRVAMALAILAAAPACMKQQPTAFEPAEPAICYQCLWLYQDPDYGEEVVKNYEEYHSDDRLVQAEVQYVLGRMHGDPGEVCDAFDAFVKRRRSGRRRQRLYVAETLAFTAPECGRDPAPYFQRASRLAGKLDQVWKAEVYDALSRDAFEPTFGDAEIARRLEAPDGTMAYILGESVIRVAAGATIGAQVERTVRDWLVFQMEVDPTRPVESPEDLLGSHEGARLKDVLTAVPATVVPLSGTLAARKGEAWFAPDENGVFRFEVLRDKVRYPTTRASGGLVLLMDTHGVSSLVQSSMREGADLVVGCGDSTGKAQAAYHLASLGVDVYFPCDRFVDELLGYDAEGILLGSAPVRGEGGEAIIGDRPLLFRVDEIIVVGDASLANHYRYYDAPARYFRKLAEALPLRIEWVEIFQPGDSSRIVQRALETGASAIAIRVGQPEDYPPVRDWLAASPERRAVLFHTAPYAAGYRLFQEFPEQTTFGDPRPRFLTANEDAP